MIVVTSDYTNKKDISLIKKYSRYVLNKFVRQSVQRNAHITIRIVSPEDCNDSIDADDLRKYHAWCTYDKSIDILDYKEEVSVYDGLVLMWEWLKQQPQRPRRYFDKYELDKKMYSYWKLNGTSSNVKIE